MPTQSGTYSYFEISRSQTAKTISKDFLTSFDSTVIYTDDLYDSNFDAILQGLRVNTQNKIKSDDVRNLAYTLYVNDYKGGIRTGTSVIRDSLNDRFREWGMMFYVIESGPANGTLWVLKPDGITIDDNTYKIPATPQNSKWVEIDILNGGTYTNVNPVPSKLGGILPGQTFSNVSYQDMFDMLLYPKTESTISLSGGGTREFGNFSNINFVYKSTNNDYPLEFESLVATDGLSVPTITLNPMGQTVNFTSGGTHSMSSNSNSKTNTFTATIKYNNGTTKTSSANITFMNKVYYGTYNFTNDPVSDSASALAELTDNDIQSLSDKGLRTSYYTIAYNGINGAGDYLIFAWPVSFADSMNPKFVVNGLANTAFTNIGTKNYENQYGYKKDYVVWVSNTRYNSPVDEFEIRKG